MKEEDSVDNKFMMTIKKILNENFDLTKKFMIEKNAKLEMVHKMKQRIPTAKSTSPNKNNVMDQKNIKYEVSIDNMD